MNIKKFRFLLFLLIIFKISPLKTAEVNSVKPSRTKNVLELITYGIFYKLFSLVQEKKKYDLSRFHENIADKKLDKQFKEHIYFELIRLSAHILFVVRSLKKIFTIKDDYTSLFKLFIGIRTFYEYLLEKKTEASNFLDFINDLKVKSRLAKHKSGIHDCPLCLTKNIYVCKQCMTPFHISCIHTTTQKKECPICRTKISLEDGQQLTALGEADLKEKDDEMKKYYEAMKKEEKEKKSKCIIM